MYKKFRIEPPFFEMGPKAYCSGPEMLKFSKAIDNACKKYDVRVILTSIHGYPHHCKGNRKRFCFCPTHGFHARRERSWIRIA